MNSFRILVVDDEPDLCEILQFNLSNEMYEVDTANSAEQALMMNLESYDLFIFDVMMGDISGFKLASMIKERIQMGKRPILFITALDTEEDILKGFNIGADDYVTKPFSVKEVILRVKAILKRVYGRSDSKEEITVVAYKTLTVDLRSKVTMVNGEQIELTKKEFEILTLLLRNMGEVFSREDLLRQIWTDEVIVLDRTIDVNITRLRKKLGEYGPCITTRVGYGYAFDPK